MNIFDILGPVMVGPSSSHTAGAVRIGYVSRKLLGEEPKNANIYFHGSFAATGIGHGTDKAIIAGILGMMPDDIRIPKSREIAQEKGLEFNISTINLKNAHPNTVLIELYSIEGRKIKITACSVGGGRIKIVQIDDIETNFSGESPTIVINNIDKPGCVAEVAKVFSDKLINIATMQIFRSKKSGKAIMIIETDQLITEDCITLISSIKGVLKATYINIDSQND